MKLSDLVRFRLAALAAAAALAAVLALALLSGEPGRPISYTVPPGSESTTRGAVRPVPVAERTPARPLELRDGDGRALALEAWRGKVVLLNLWATWCPPCVAEMPDLDAVQARLGGAEFEVVAVSLDRGGADIVRRWFAKAGISHLGIYVADPAAAGAEALPASFLLDRQGRVAWQGLGARKWTDPATLEAIGAVMAEK